jgi:hypothetical protein
LIPTPQQAGEFTLTDAPESSLASRRSPASLLTAAAILLGVGHAAAILQACGGWAGLTGPWPIPTHDHPLQFHSSTLAPSFFAQSGTNAGYDPAFMAGYPKSILFPPSSTMFDVAAWITQGRWPAVTYKVMVFLSVASFPFLLLVAARLLDLDPIARLAVVALGLIYVWTNGGEAGFPLNYALFGMVPYFLAIPLALAWLGTFVRFLVRGGVPAGLAAVLLGVLTWMVHITTPFVVAPAAACAYVSACRVRGPDGRPLLTRGRHLAVWWMPAVIVALNAFWWWPGVVLRSELGESGFALAHSEPVLGRLADILWKAPLIQVALYALTLLGAARLARRLPIAAAALLGLLAAGFFWGYAAGFWRAFDFLQPGRHTYALHLAATMLAGAGVGALLSPSPGGRRAASIGWAIGLSLLAVRLFGPSVTESLTHRIGSDHRPGFLSSRPPARLLWVVEQVKRHMKPGERLLYEESGFDVPGEPDPYEGGRYSGLLPWLTGVEVLGGPYLHAAVRANFTQFGEGRLFGRSDWTEAEFRESARIYRPSAILCWTARAVAFCEAHPELVEILAVDERPMLVLDARTGRPAAITSRLVFGRIRGEEPANRAGDVEVAASPGRLVVRRPSNSAELDAPAVLRYHYVPGLAGRPPIALRPVTLGDDPVPFIGLEPPLQATTIELSFRPGGGASGPPGGESDSR